MLEWFVVIFVIIVSIWCIYLFNKPVNLYMKVGNKKVIDFLIEETKEKK